MLIRADITNTKAVIKPEIIRDTKGKTGVIFLKTQTKKAKIAKTKPNIGTKDKGSEITATVQENFEVFLARIE